MSVKNEGDCRFCETSKGLGYKYCLECGAQVNDEYKPVQHNRCCFNCSSKTGKEKIIKQVFEVLCPKCGEPTWNLYEQID